MEDTWRMDNAYNAMDLVSLATMDKLVPHAVKVSTWQVDNVNPNAHPTHSPMKKPINANHATIVVEHAQDPNRINA